MKTKSTDDLVYVYCSLCDPILVIDVKKPLLRRVNASRSDILIVVINQPYYLNTRIVNNYVSLYKRMLKVI